MYPPQAFELGYIEVTSEQVDPVDLSALTFTPGMPASSDIQPQQITGELSVNFQVNSNLTKLPIPQFVIDDKGCVRARGACVRAPGAARHSCSREDRLLPPT